jgi:hypothetical protein
MSEGVLYVATGQDYINEAIRSAKSLKRHNPSVPITLYTNNAIESNVFDEVRTVQDPIEHKGDSILDSRHFPYDRNLYLDSDTYVCADISRLFDILDSFDIAATHDIARIADKNEIYTKNEINIPEAFTEYNTGVVAFNNCNAVKKLFADWNRIYTQMKYDDQQPNQPSFRVALFRSGVNIATLPPEYNLFMDTVGFVSGEAKICHQSISNIDPVKFSEKINETHEMRVITHERYPFRVVPNSKETVRYRFAELTHKSIQIIKKEGMTGLLTAGKQKFLN